MNKEITVPYAFEPEPTEKTFTIGIISKETPFHNAVLEGLKIAIQKSGKAQQLQLDIVIDEHNDWPSVTGLTKEILDRSPDLLLTIGAFCTQIAIQTLRERKLTIPFLYGGVGNPRDLGLFDSKVTGGIPIAGASLGQTSYLTTAKLLQFLKPTVKSILLPYSVNSDAGMQENAALFLQEFFKSQHVQVTLLPVEEISSLAELIMQRLSHHDTLLCFEDCPTNEYSKEIAAVCRAKGITYFASNPDAVKNGAAIGFVADPTMVGRQLYVFVERVLLGGTKIKDLSPIFLREKARHLMINQTELAKQGLDISPEKLEFLRCGELHEHYISPYAQRDPVEFCND